MRRSATRVGLDPGPEVARPPDWRVVDEDGNLVRAERPVAPDRFQGPVEWSSGGPPNR
jgi:hypothetical protein